MTRIDAGKASVFKLYTMYFISLFNTCAIGLPYFLPLLLLQRLSPIRNESWRARGTDRCGLDGKQ